MNNCCVGTNHQGCCEWILWIIIIFIILNCVCGNQNSCC